MCDEFGLIEYFFANLLISLDCFDDSHNLKQNFSSVILKINDKYFNVCARQGTVVHVIHKDKAWSSICTAIAYDLICVYLCIHAFCTTTYCYHIEVFGTAHIW